MNLSLANTVHLWVVDLKWSESELGVGLLTLSDYERERAQRLLIERARVEYIASHCALRHILSSYIGVAPKVINFSTHQHGKPYVSFPLVDIEFNLSHTRGYALIGIAQNQSIGVDIEYHKPAIDVEALAKRFFPKSEYEQLMQLPAAERYFAFYRIWTRKEAFIKVTGQGLSFGLHNFVVSLQEEGSDCLLSVNESAKLARQWTLAPVFIGEGGYSAAFALRGSAEYVQIKSWKRNELGKCS